VNLLSRHVSAYKLRSLPQRIDLVIVNPLIEQAVILPGINPIGMSEGL